MLKQPQRSDTDAVFDATESRFTWGLNGAARSDFRIPLNVPRLLAVYTSSKINI